jgi:lipopolysaccharide transport system ATP-binding protein
MYVRLAFAVAAHLEPEILIVDEVLAVGDAEFQKKALGKMKDVSGSEGRTVLFVSHNMEAVQNLCSHAILMADGECRYSGNVQDVISFYMKKYVNENKIISYSINDAPIMNSIRLRKASVYPAKQKDGPLYLSDLFHLSFEFDFLDSNSSQLDITYHLIDERGILVYVGSTVWTHNMFFKSGKISAACSFPGDILNEGTYNVGRLLVVQNKGAVLAEFNNVLTFDLLPNQKTGYFGWSARKEGVLKLKSVSWHIDYDPN